MVQGQQKSLRDAKHEPGLQEKDCLLISFQLIGLFFTTDYFLFLYLISRSFMQKKKNEANKITTQTLQQLKKYLINHTKCSISYYPCGTLPYGDFNSESICFGDLLENNIEH